MTSWTDPDGTVSYTYDNNGNVLTVTDPQGTITRTYDALNRVISYTDVNGNTLHYEYDEVGNLVTLAYPDGKLVPYEYDANDQLVKVTDWAGRETRYEYDANGRLIKTLRPNGTVQTRQYDVKGQLLAQTDLDVQGNVLVAYTFSYDAAGNLVQEQVTPEWLPVLPTSVKMTYTAANRLATYNGQAVQFDADGNLITGPLAGGMANFQFDSRNRLVSAGETSYRYDAENQRIGVNQTNYVINSQPALSQVLVKEENGVKTFYVYGLGLIGEEREGEYLAYHFDFRGSTVAITDQTGKVVERFQYAPYGELIIGDVTQTPFLFNGMYGVMTDESGLYYMRARFYSPEIKRFINQDILLGNIAEGQTLNRFAFVNSNPLSSIDPLGLAQVLIVAIGQTNVYYDATASQLVNIINALPNSSVLYFRISGHGNEGSIALMRKDKGEDYINGYAMVDDNRVPQILGYDNQGNAYIAGRLDKLLKDKLHPLAKIEFAGCQTAKGDENISKWMSLLLPEFLVTGGATYQLGYVEGSTLIPFDGPSGMLGWKKTYLTTGDRTYEWTEFSFFE